MPKIDLDSKTILGAKGKIGIYRPKSKELIYSEDEIQSRFRDFLKTHKRWTQDMENETWLAFLPYLRGIK